MYFLAYSKNPDVRYKATSGGFTKEVIAHALRSGYVDYLIFPTKRGCETEIVVTNTIDDSLFSPSTNSVYDLCNPLEGLKRIPTGKTAGMTLLPCMMGARKFAKVKFVIELLCDYSQSVEYSHKLCGIMGVRPNEVEFFSYRTGIWPGTTIARTFDGRVFKTPFGKHWKSDPVADAAPKKCQSCRRFMTGGDMIVADPWRLMKKWRRPGKTMVSIQNEEVLDLAKSANVILEPITEADWKKSTSAHVRKRNTRD